MLPKLNVIKINKGMLKGSYFVDEWDAKSVYKVHDKPHCTTVVEKNSCSLMVKGDYINDILKCNYDDFWKWFKESGKIIYVSCNDPIQAAIFSFLLGQHQQDIISDYEIDFTGFTQWDNDFKFMYYTNDGDILFKAYLDFPTDRGKEFSDIFLSSPPVLIKNSPSNFWNFFFHSKIVQGVHCKTKKEAIEFCEIANTLGQKWGDRTDYSKDITRWENYKKGTYYSNDGRYGIIDYFNENNYTIYEFSDIVSQKSESTTAVIDTKQIKSDISAQSAGKEKEGRNMKNNLMEKMMESFMPKQVSGDEVALTMDGRIAVKRGNGDYVVYNTDTKTIENQMNLVLNGEDISKLCFFMPTQVLVIGDIYKENQTFYCVTGDTNGIVKTVNLSTGRGASSVKETNVILGTKFFQKVTSLFNMTNGAAGGMNPMMMAMMMDGDYYESGESTDSMFKMIALSQMMGQGENTGMAINPMMMAMMMGKSSGGDGDMIKMMMMSQMMSGQGVNPFQTMFGAQTPVSVKPETEKTRKKSTETAVVDER